MEALHALHTCVEGVGKAALAAAPFGERPKGERRFAELGFAEDGDLLGLGDAIARIAAINEPVRETGGGVGAVGAPLSSSLAPEGRCLRPIAARTLESDPPAPRLLLERSFRTGVSHAEVSS